MTPPFTSSPHPPESNHTILEVSGPFFEIAMGVAMAIYIFTNEVQYNYRPGRPMFLHHTISPERLDRSGSNFQGTFETAPE